MTGCGFVLSIIIFVFRFLLVRVIREDLNCSKNNVVCDRDVFLLHNLLLWHQIYLKMPSIHPSAIWLILFRVMEEGGARGRIHPGQVVNPCQGYLTRANAFTFTPSRYFEFLIHLSCQSLDCCKKLDHLEETPQTIKCPNKITIHTDLVHAVKYVCCFLSVTSVTMFVCPVPQSKIILSVGKMFS